MSNSWKVNVAEPATANHHDVNDSNNVTAVYFRSKSDAMTLPMTSQAGAVDVTKETVKSRCLDVDGVSYSVKLREGAWWKGACFRKQQERHILRDVTLRVRSGGITAILGNSGRYL